MGADENATIVRRGYEAFNAGDMDTLTELFDESAAWHTPGRSPIAGDHEGRVVGIHRNTAERNGKRLDVTCCLVLELKEGRIADGREYFSDTQAWDDFWS